MEHSQHHEAFLRRLVGESEDPWEGLLASEFADCDACGEALERLLAGGVAETARRVDAAARDEREALDARGTFSTEQEKELVRRALTPELSVARAAPPFARRRLLLAAGLAAAVLGLVWFASTREGREDPRLGPAGLRVLAPVGAVAQWGEFRWEAQVPTGGAFAVEVLDEAGQRIGGVERVETPNWTPAPNESATWPSRIRVRVRVLGAAGERIDVAEVEAWLSER